MKQDVEIALLGALRPPVVEALEQNFTVHRICDEPDPLAAIAKLGQRIRGAASHGMAGLSRAQIDLLPKLEICAINGVGLEEPYVQSWAGNGDFPPQSDAVDGQVIPSGMYFVMGDNRDHSSDSRLFGYVSRDEIDGKAVLRVWPWSHLALLDVHPTLARG